jgi:hypothetical protein
VVQRGGRVERGSKIATSRRPGKRSRTAAIVSATAVGWCAKSSSTVTPPASPTTSCRRRTPRKLASPCSRAGAGTPRATHAATAPTAFSTFDERRLVDLAVHQLGVLALTVLPDGTTITGGGDGAMFKLGAGRALLGGLYSAEGPGWTDDSAQGQESRGPLITTK